MSTMIRVSRHGRLTLPPALCRKLGLDKLRAPMVIVEERKSGLLLRPAPTIPSSHRAELNLRLAALAKNPEQGRPWTKVHGELQAGASLGKQPSPAWHSDALREAERAVKAGKAKFVDWELAKKRLGRVSAKSRPRSRRS
jgi:hypothetical protein